MATTIETYIQRIISDLECSPKEKSELAEELSGHLQLLVEEFKERGFEEEKATALAIKEFGDPALIQEGIQSSMMPERKLIHLVGWLIFGAYSFLLIWQLIIFRFIENMNTWDSSNSYFRMPAEAQGFFSVEAWKLNSNIIPFFTTYNYITGTDIYNLDIILRNTIGNVLLFVPIGFLLILLVKRLNTIGKVAMVGFTITLVIEMSQFFLQVGQFDIDDVLLNTLGAILGCTLFKVLNTLWGYLQSSKSKEITE